MQTKVCLCPTELLVLLLVCEHKLMQSKSIDGNQRSVLTEDGAEHVLKHAFQPIVFQKWFCLTDSGPHASLHD